MNHFGSQFLIAVSSLSLALCAQNVSQSASSVNHFLASFEFGSGGRAFSSNHLLDGSCGSGVVATMAFSSNHVLMGGFNSSLDAAFTGKPWLSAVIPRFTAMRSGATVTIHGTDLQLGTAVTIGGQPATILSSAPDEITVAVPNQDVPGFRPVTVKSNAGETTLTEGLGVLPLIYEENAAASGVPFTLVFKGTQGDSVVWVIGIRPAVPIPIFGLGYGLAIDPSFMIVVPGFSITDVNGEFRTSFGSLNYATGLLLAQGLFISSNPAYAPGAFTNVLQL